jgi:hypothetical protein
MLYSYRGGRPAPLPWRIILSNGFSRTDPSTFTKEEISAAGFTGPYAEPSYNPAVECLDWIDGKYSISSLPPLVPDPQWINFSIALANDISVKQLLVTLMNSEPALYLMIGVGMGQASKGEFDTFLLAWKTGIELKIITQEMIEHVTVMSEKFNLPKDFIVGLNQK